MREIDALLVRYRAMSAGELKDLLKNAVLEKEIEQACLGVLEEKIGGAQVDAFKAELRVQEKGPPGYGWREAAFLPLWIGVYLVLQALALMFIAVVSAAPTGALLLAELVLLLFGGTMVALALPMGRRRLFWTLRSSLILGIASIVAPRHFLPEVEDSVSWANPAIDSALRLMDGAQFVAATIGLVFALVVYILTASERESRGYGPSPGRGRGPKGDALSQSARPVARVLDWLGTFGELLGDVVRAVLRRD